MTKKGLLLQLRRGLYQLPDSSLDANHSLAEAAKLVPKGVVCPVTALAYHELTDTIPSRVWMAIGPKDRRPRATQAFNLCLPYRLYSTVTGVPLRLIKKSMIS
jgi:predicted transcriptional regulator of viral defense system